jgi:outer membrane protein assembly factor BamB
LIEKRVVARKAMRDPPKRSVLDGDVNVTQSFDVANEILNDIQRMRGGDTVLEDESRYLVTVRPLNGRIPAWSGEVAGPPLFYPLHSVNVLAAGKTVTVLDKSNRKLWQATLTHNVPARIESLTGEDSPFGEGPCVERGDRLFVYDEAVLTAFELRTGTAHWRLPTVGVMGLFFDEEGMLYVNSTTASLDNLKYSKQIDVTQTTAPVVFKIDPKAGKMLWSVQPRGFISAVSGKFIYAVTSDGTFIKMRRLNPKTGRVMWEYLDQRAPISVQFHQNSIQLVFPREVQVLKFLSF